MTSIEPRGDIQVTAVSVALSVSSLTSFSGAVVLAPPAAQPAISTPAARIATLVRHHVVFFIIDTSFLFSKTGQNIKCETTLSHLSSAKEL
jgi:hypothetical protein